MSEEALPKWEQACEPSVPGGRVDTYRLRVPGGWIYEVMSQTTDTSSVCFVPTPSGGAS